MTDGVLARPVGRRDILLMRGATNSIAALWEQDRGDGYRPVDLTGWRCSLELLPPAGGAAWYRIACAQHGKDGKACATIPPDAFSASAWASRTSGRWRITADRDGTVERLGWGYWTMTD